MSTDTSDPLDRFIVDAEEGPDLGLLAAIIDGYLRFTKDGAIIYEKKFHQLKEHEKLVMCLLGRKIIKIKNLVPDFKEEIKPKEIFDITGIKPKSITGYLCRQLKGVTKSIKGAHYIPNYNIYKCAELMKSDNSKRSN